MKVQLALSVALPQRAAQTFTCQFGNLELPKLKSATCLCCGSRSHTNPKLVPGVIATSQCFDRLELPKPQSLDSVIPMLLCTGLVFSVMICSRLDVLVINRLILFLQHEDPVEGGGSETGTGTISRPGEVHGTLHDSVKGNRLTLSLSLSLPKNLKVT